MIKSLAAASVLIALSAAAPALATPAAPDGSFIVADIRPPTPWREEDPPKRPETRPTPQKPTDSTTRPTRPQPSDGPATPRPSDDSGGSTAALVVAILSAIAIGAMLRGRRREAA